jgi:hypothetical protein
VTAGLASLVGVLLKKCSNFVQGTPFILGYGIGLGGVAGEAFTRKEDFSEE